MNRLFALESAVDFPAGREAFDFSLSRGAGFDPERRNPSCSRAAMISGRARSMPAVLI